MPGIVTQKGLDEVKLAAVVPDVQSHKAAPFEPGSFTVLGLDSAFQIRFCHGVDGFDDPVGGVLECLYDDGFRVEFHGGPYPVAFRPFEGFLTTHNHADMVIDEINFVNDVRHSPNLRSEALRERFLWKCFQVFGEHAASTYECV